MEAFVYMWENIRTGKKYIGVHKGALDDGYIASSKSFMRDYMTTPYMFKRTVIAKGDYQLMYEEETRVLQMVDARNNPLYYNQHNNEGPPPGSKKGRIMSESWRKKQRQRIYPAERMAKLHEGRRNSKNSPEHNEAIRQSNIRRAR